MDGITTGGGGGAYFSHGKNGQDNYDSDYGIDYVIEISGGFGGIMYGNLCVNKLYCGSGAGSGHSYDTEDDINNCGGSGGGIIFIKCHKIKIDKNCKILSNGMNAKIITNDLGYV